MAKNKNSIAIIPARFQSSRFPGKPLVQISGKSLIQRVYEQALKCDSLNSVIVATDDQRIFEHVQSFGRVTMTSPFHKSGTDRCAEIAQLDEFQDYETIINIQGDEPFVQPQQINALLLLLEKHPEFSIGTLAKKIVDEEDIFNPNVVKLVFDKDFKALYFSRSPIPYVQTAEQKDWLATMDFYKHLGVYGFRRETLLKIAKLKQAKLELAESLEQLRWLEAGKSIGIHITDYESIGIDTPEDLPKGRKHDQNSCYAPKAKRASGLSAPSLLRSSGRRWGFRGEVI